MSGGYPVSGAIDPQAFPFLIVDLHQRGATGSLKVEGPSYQKALYFRGGRILFGSSNDPRDQLGAILIETGTLTPEQLEDANSKVGPGNPLAKVLSDTGFVSQRELGEAARAKVERILADVVAYTAGSFEFEDGVLPKGAVDLKLSTEHVVLAAVRRVSDRGFVLRHLDGLDVVLTPVPEARGSKPEVEAEAGEVLGRIDGKTTLKQVAAGTRLDEFDAAKVACALVFLGLVRRRSEPAPLSTLPTAAAASGFGEIDLMDTAREAFVPVAAPPRRTESPPPPEPAVPAISFEAPAEPFAPAAADGPEMSLFVPDDVKPVGPPPAPTPPPPAPAFGVEPDPVPIFVPEPAPAAAPPPDPAFAAPTPAPSTSASRPLPLIPPPPPRTPTPSPVMSSPEPAGVPVPDTAPYIPSRTPELSIPPVPAGVGPSKREAREWKPPGRGGAPTPPRASPLPDIDEPAELTKTATPPRPSKDDLAALDALLNSKGLEGPLQPMERPAGDRWSPQFGATRGGARPVASGGGRGRAALLALLLVAAASAALYYYLGRTPPDASAHAVPPPVTVADASTPAPPASLEPTAVPSPLAATAAPAARPTPAPTPRVAAATPRAAAPTPAPTAPPASPRAGAAPAGGLREARALLASGDLAAAARGFSANVRSAPAGSASVQLLIACSDATVQKAVSAVSSPELFIVPVKYQGRDCYRLLWGLYANSAQAATAARSVPEYFRKNGAAPRVMSASELRP
jgi:hypothetical protein